jgi:ketosteroid isomerase-like protein
VSKENVEIVKRLTQAFNAKKLDEFAALTTADFEWSPSMVAIEGELFVGRAGIETYFDRMREGWDSFRLEDGEFSDLGDRVMWTGRLEGRGKISGATVSAPLDILYEVREKVCSMRSFLDRDEAVSALKAMGIEE